MSVLRFENVSKQYPGGHQALVDVSFDVAEGEMLFVTGHSGAGKSTLLKLIHLSERPSRGAVLLPMPNSLRISTPRLRAATWSRWRLRTLSIPRTQTRRPPPVSQVCAKLRSTYSLRRRLSARPRARCMRRRLR